MTHPFGAVRRLGTALRYLGDFARDLELVHDGKILFIEKYNFHVGRVLLYGRKSRAVVDFDATGEAYCCTNRQGRRGITYRAYTAELEEKPGKCCFSDMPCDWPNFLMHYTNRICSRASMRRFVANLVTYRRLFRLE